MWMSLWASAGAIPGALESLACRDDTRPPDLERGGKMGGERGEAVTKGMLVVSEGSGSSVKDEGLGGFECE